MKELSFEQMENIQAGISAKEYCKTVRMIYESNPDERHSEGLMYAMNLCHALGQ
ncbi:hypothetical protein [Marinifilum caeruleilacunae]|uniref:hypothetical protein n=1 Tax=Marinifilum caeruleilacunae TaxID=2499076 RepID=UPI001492006D|nr:hypothetical protein [Marinifilum caeruleilacunae]